MEVFKSIIVDVLTALYEPIGFALILAVFFMFTRMFAKEKGGWRKAVEIWIKKFRTEALFRKEFLFTIVVAMILFKTLLNRDMWQNPLSNVIGIWGLYDSNGELTAEAFENVVLFIPLTGMFFWVSEEKPELLPLIIKSFKISILFSLAIEFCQLFLRLGTFQLSDIVQNTFGGIIGGIIYILIAKIHSFYIEKRCKK